jgi:signal peptidase I
MDYPQPAKPRYDVHHYGIAAVVSVITAVLLHILIIDRFFTSVYRFRDNSMSPAYRMNDTVRVDKRFFRFSDRPYPRGRLYLIRCTNRGTSALIVLRLMGLPGETVAIRDNHFLVNGRPSDDPWGQYPPKTVPAVIQSKSRLRPQTVPDGYYFFLADNRNHGVDSRHLGAVKQDDIIGRVF